MTHERFQQIRNVFKAALERDAGQRTAFIEEACRGDELMLGEVQKLLRATTLTDDFLDQPPISGGPPRDSLGGSRMEGRNIGSYEILRQLGRGGMGTVYLASRADDAYRKQVAIKVMRAGIADPELIGRFRQEREILAALDHPNIARLIDGGGTGDGLLYLVMEYVHGQPIDTYCDHNQRDVTQRLDLFRSLCSAVHYLHQHGVVHRDLKPSNILVSAEGTVKLLDFGIAKLLRPLNDRTAYATLPGLRLMTPEYASPEQVKGELMSPLTDIYSLGVILYELLTGHRPYRIHSRIFHEIVRAICDEPPTRPSRVVTRKEERFGDEREITPEGVSRARHCSPEGLKRSLSGDLDSILLKALQKDCLERYRSADQFSEDILLHLEDQPVMARGTNALYRLAKVLNHYRVAIIAAVALTVTVGSGGITIHKTGVMVLGVAVAMLGLCYAAADPKLGRRIAESGLYTQPFWALLASLCAFGLVLVLPSKYQGAILASLQVAVSLYFLTQLVAWWARECWAGVSFLDLSPPRTKLAVIGAGAMVVLYGGGTIFDRIKGGCSEFDQWVFALSPSILVACSTALFGRLDFRQRGVVREGRLWRWVDMESYVWEADTAAPQFLLKLPAGGNPILKIWMRRKLQFLPPIRLRIPVSRQEEVESLMSRYLSEWPVLSE